MLFTAWQQQLFDEEEKCFMSPWKAKFSSDLNDAYRIQIKMKFQTLC